MRFKGLFAHLHIRAGLDAAISYALGPAAPEMGRIGRSKAVKAINAMISPYGYLH